MRELYQSSGNPVLSDIADEGPLAIEALEQIQPSAKRFAPYVPTHDRDYPFDNLVPYYGSDFCGLLAEAWPPIFGHEKKSSTEHWFNSLKRTLVIVAVIGESAPNSVVGQVYRHLRDRPREPLATEPFQDALEYVIQKVSDLSDRSIFKSDCDTTRSSFVTNLNAALHRLAMHRVFPSIAPLSARLTKSRFTKTVPSLSELTRSGRAAVPVVPGSDLSLEAHVTAMVELNVMRLTALRSCLEQEFIAEYTTFKRGQSWLARTDLPDADSVDAAIRAVSQAKAHGHLGHWRTTAC